MTVASLKDLLLALGGILGLCAGMAALFVLRVEFEQMRARVRQLEDFLSSQLQFRPASRPPSPE